MNEQTTHADGLSLLDAIEEAVDIIREETANVKPPPPHLRSIEAFIEFMSNLPQYVPPSEEEWNEGMKRAEAFHRALNSEEECGALMDGDSDNG